ncbi:MAG: metallophosphatase domain-containing protein [bacterium]
MKIVVISDTHGLHSQLNVPQGDVLIHAGDVCRDPSQLTSFLNWFENQAQDRKILVPGNHDFPLHYQNERYREQCKQRGIDMLIDDTTAIQDVTVHGTPWTPTFGQWVYQKDDSKLDKYFRQIPQNTDLLVSHGPPKDILDQTTDGRRVGSRSLRSTVENVSPQYHVFGHIHEARGKTTQEGTTFINASCFPYPSNNPTDNTLYKPFSLSIS